MNQFRKHIPAFVEADKSTIIEFINLDELLNHPNFDRWDDAPGFYRYSLSENCLMAEFFAGRSWWVIGYLMESPSGLPDWFPVYCVYNADGQIIDLYDDVEFSSGDEVHLKSGEVLKKVDTETIFKLYGNVKLKCSGQES